MRKYGETIYDTRGNVIAPQQWGVVTQKGDILYAHILNGLKEQYVFIPDVKQKISKANLFGNTAELKFKQQPEGVFVYLPGVSLNSIDTIIQLQ
jgi:alpha-L-fucosidase